MRHPAFCAKIPCMKLLTEIKSCNLCQEDLPCVAKPVLQFHRNSQVLITGQAPGLMAHNSGIPWNDASGVRLRSWLKIDEQVFYNTQKISIVPIGFCYPGRGKSGDLPPRKECSIRWLDSILCHLTNLKILILVGQYATNYYLGNGPLASKIRQHAINDSSFLVLPHPSPRNNIWLKKNSWFEEEYLELIRKKMEQGGVFF
jgi:uracil-DNA glycosylase